MSHHVLKVVDSMSDTATDDLRERLIDLLHWGALGHGNRETTTCRDKEFCSYWIESSLVVTNDLLPLITAGKDN